MPPESPREISDGLSIEMVIAERTRVDLVVAEDADALFRYYQRNEAHLQQWEPKRANGHHCYEAWQARAAEQERNVAAGSSYHFAIRLLDSGAIVGLCNFDGVTRGAFLACYLGYSVDHEHEGQGLMYEALSVAIPFVFENYGLHRVMANYMPDNARSGRLLQRLGFEKEGYARSYLKIANVWQDHILTARVNPN